MPRLTTTELANLVIESIPDDIVNDKKFRQLNSEILLILASKDVEQLSYWLLFNSFTKHKLDQLVSRQNSGEIKNPSVNLKSEIRKIFLAYLEELLVKQNNIPKYETEDFSPQCFYYY